jgi:hypothetical protein
MNGAMFFFLRSDATAVRIAFLQCAENQHLSETSTVLVLQRVVLIAVHVPSESTDIGFVDHYRLTSAADLAAVGFRPAWRYGCGPA